MTRRRAAAAASVALVVAGLAVAGVVATRPDAPPPVGADQGVPGPVLLVPGYGGSTAALEVLAAALRRAGRDAQVVPAVGDGTGDLGTQAAALRAAADARVVAGAPSVDVVGYSAGGVVARLWATTDDGARRVRRVVTLGSPHHGTQVAALAAAFLGDCPAACRQLVPGSDLLDALPETAPGPAWTSVWTEADQVVTPPSSARLDGAVNVPLQSVCADASTVHGDLPRDPLVVGLVDAALDGAPLAAAPGPERCTVLRDRGAVLTPG